VNGPDDDLRAAIAHRVDVITERLPSGFLDPQAEEALEALLLDVEVFVRNDIEADAVVTAAETGGAEVSESGAEDLLAAVHAWASVASYAAARIYAPSSPMRRSLAGWSKKVAGVLQRIAGILLTPLRVAAAALGASSWSITVNFPWTGVGVGLSWP
jgi:hypothetical protein